MERPEELHLPEGEITCWLQQWKEGSSEAGECFVAAVYHDLRNLAHYYLNDEHRFQTLQTDDLIGEVFRRLVDPSRLEAVNRKQFYALAAEVMRHVLLDWAKARRAQKRSGAWNQVSL